jgi:hypothetical protein
MGAIRGPDYDRYSDSCLTLLLDPKCGGNGWAFEIFLEFDNAHRIQQWSTGAAFDDICPMRMAHFAAMAAQTKLKRPLPFLTQQGGGRSAPGQRPRDWCLLGRPRAGASPTITPASAPTSRLAAGPPPITASTAVTPGPMRPVPAPAISTSSPPCPPGPLRRTIQENRCPGRWRSFPPAKVAWIEHLLTFRPLRLSAWQDELCDDEDREFLLYLVEHGLSISDTNSTLKTFNCKNYKSAYVAADHVDVALQPDVALHRIFRPFNGEVSPFVHALGAVPKTESTVRVIHNHSRPFGRSLNDSMTQSNFSLSSVDDAVRLMRPGCYMAKVDIEAAYRYVPIDLNDWGKLAFCWPSDDEADMYLDGYLQFGMMNACKVFNRIGRAIVRMMMRRGHKCIVVYVDDFIIMCESQAMVWYVYWTQVRLPSQFETS